MDANESTIEIEIKDFSEKISEVLRSSWLGVGDVDELSDLIYEDHDIHAHSLAQQFGFPSFKDFLHSEHMKGYMDIETGNNVTSYHFPLSTLMDDEKMRMHSAHNTEFLQMDREMKLRRRNGYWVPGQSRINRPKLMALLLKRYKKRMGIHDPEDDEPKPPPAVSGRGRRKSCMTDEDTKTTQPSTTTNLTPSEPAVPASMAERGGAAPTTTTRGIPASMAGRGGAAPTTTTRGIPASMAGRGGAAPTTTTRGIRTMFQPAGMAFGRSGFGRGGGRGSTAGRMGLGRGGIGGGRAGTNVTTPPSLFDEFFNDSL